MRSPSARTVSPRRSGSTAESSSSTCAPEPCETATGGPTGRPELGAVQPGRQDRRLDEPRQDGDSLGRRVGDTPRDAARALELRSAARLQPRRGDALHGESRRHGDRLGSQRATAGSGVAFTFTNDRRFSATGFDGHPGSFSPDGRLIAVGLKEQGIALWDASDSSRSRRPCSQTGGEVKSLAFSPDGQTLAAVTAGGSLTLWDVDSRSRLQGPFTVATARPGRQLQPRRRNTRNGRHRRRREILGRRNRSRSRRDRSRWGLRGPSPSALTGRSSRSANLRREAPEVWDVAKRSLVASMEGGDKNEDATVALSPDGRMLAVGGFGRVVRLWDVQTPEARPRARPGRRGRV